MSDLIIETAGLRKVYGRKVAVADLTLQVPQGEVFGFLGPNGAGKSTSIKMLLGLVRPTGGMARVLGRTPTDPTSKTRIGFLPEHFRFHEWLRAGEFLDIHGRLYGMAATVRKRRVPEVLDLVGLSSHVREPLSGFSKGMLQRIGIAQALIHEPDVVFLDEPTSALDPFGRRLVRSIIHDLKSRGTTVFLNSHLLSEVEATCDRVSFIKEGRVLQTLGLHDLHPGHLSVEVRVDCLTPELMEAMERLMAEQHIRWNGAAPALFHDQAPTLLSNLNGAATGVAVVAPTTIKLLVAEEDLLPLLVERIVASGARLYALTPQQTSLEQLFLDIVGIEDSGQ